MVKIRYRIYAFTIYESLLQNVIKILTINYQKRTKVLGKSSKFQVELSGKISCINCAQVI